MLGDLWASGVSIDPGRLIDDGDTAYYLTVVAAYRKFSEHRAERAERANNAVPAA